MLCFCLTRHKWLTLLLLVFLLCHERALSQPCLTANPPGSATYIIVYNNVTESFDGPSGVNGLLASNFNTQPSYSQMSCTNDTTYQKNMCAGFYMQPPVLGGSAPVLDAYFHWSTSFEVWSSVQYAPSLTFQYRSGNYADETMEWIFASAGAFDTPLSVLHFDIVSNNTSHFWSSQPIMGFPLGNHTIDLYWTDAEILIQIDGSIDPTLSLRLKSADFAALNLAWPTQADKFWVVYLASPIDFFTNYVPSYYRMYSFQVDNCNGSAIAVPSASPPITTSSSTPQQTTITQSPTTLLPPPSSSSLTTSPAQTCVGFVPPCANWICVEGQYWIAVENNTAGCNSTIQLRMPVVVNGNFSSNVTIVAVYDGHPILNITGAADLGGALILQSPIAVNASRIVIGTVGGGLQKPFDSVSLVSPCRAYKLGNVEYDSSDRTMSVLVESSRNTCGRKRIKWLIPAIAVAAVLIIAFLLGVVMLFMRCYNFPRWMWVSMDKERTRPALWKQM